MSAKILIWKAIPASFTRFKLVTGLFVKLQLSHWIDHFAEPASTRFLANKSLMVKNILSRELKTTETAFHWRLIFITSVFMSIQFNERLFKMAESTCMGSAVTAMWCCVLSLNPN